MRTAIAAISMVCVFSFLLAPLTGCGGGGVSKPPPALTAEEAEAKGMVEDPNNPGSFMYPPESENGGYASSGYDDESGGYDDEDEYDDESSRDDAMAADDGGYDEGYGNDYASSNPSSNDEYGGDPDPYATTNETYEVENDAYDVGSGGNSDGYDEGYGDERVAEGSDVFNTKIVPILRARCYNCHGGGPRGRKGGLELHTAAAIAESGMVAAQSTADSELFTRITMGDDERGKMPPRGPRLTQDEIETIQEWIDSGADYGEAAGGGGDAYASGGYSDDAYSDDAYGNDAYSDDAYGNDGYGDAYDTGPRGGRRGGPGGEAGPPPPPKNLAESAMQSFQRGNDATAMNLLFAQSLLSDSEAAKEVLGKYGWVKGLKRSKLAVRWGVGIKYRGKDGWEGSPRPTGVVQDLPGNDRNRDRGGDNEGIETDFSNRTLEYYGGDVGDELVLRLQMRMERGFYGKVLKTALDSALAGDEDEDGFGGGRGFRAGRGGGDGYGDAYGPGPGGRGNRGDDDDGKPDGERIEQIMPGVMMVGESSSLGPLMVRAKQQGVDLLVVLDVVAEANRRLRIVNNTTRVRLYEVGTGEQVAISGSIKNVEIQKAGSEDQTIIEEMDKVFKVADENYKLEEFPAKATASAAIKLVQSLIGQQTDNPLWKLSEVKFYHDKGLLKDTHLASAFKRVAPEQSAKLEKISDEKEIRELLSDWITVSVPGGAGGEDDFGDDDEYGEEDDRDDGRRRQREFR